LQDVWQECQKVSPEVPEVIALFVELRPFPPSHLRTFLSNFVATGVYALSLKSLPAVFFPCQQSFFLASSLFSFPCLSFFLTLFEPNSEFHPCLGEAATTLVVIQTLSQTSPQPPLATLLRGTTHPIQATQTCPPQALNQRARSPPRTCTGQHSRKQSILKPSSYQIHTETH